MSQQLSTTKGMGKGKQAGAGREGIGWKQRPASKRGVSTLGEGKKKEENETETGRERVRSWIRMPAKEGGIKGHKPLFHSQGK